MADHVHALPSGYRLAAYEFKEVLSLGNYGIKYVGLDRAHDRKVAIKEYLPDGLAVRRDVEQALPKSSADKAMFDLGLARFLDEARVQARLEEPHLVRIHEVLRANGTGYIVMDYVEGDTLAHILARRGTLSEEEVRAVVRPLLEPLERVHGMGFVHQDIRPGAIVVRTDGAPVLLDLGAGRQTLGGARQTFGDRRKSFNLSTPEAGFSALELYSDRGRLGPWTDIYALGAVMYNCLAGQPPPDAPSRVGDDDLAVAQAVKRPCSEQVLAAIEAALALPAGQRPASIEAWRAKLQYGSADSEPQRPGHMARGGTRVSARGYGAAASRRKTANSPSRRRMAWAMPTLGAAALVVMLTYLDVGVLRSCEGADCNPVVDSAVVAASGPAPALPASLTVYTVPPDAEVSIDGRRVGRTPLELNDLPAGDYRLTLSHLLYEDVVLEEAVASGSSTVVERTLVRASGTLAVTSTPAGAWLEVNGERVGSTPMTVQDVPVGPLTLTLGADGYRSREVAAAARKDRTVEIDVSLEASIAYGTLALTLTPADATVTLPDIVERYSPGMQLPHGSYSIVASREGYRSETRTVEIAGDEYLTIALVAEPQPFTIATMPADAAVRFLAGAETYSPGMLLPPGPYRVQAVLLGYRVWEETITHGTEPTRREVTLAPGVTEFADRLRSGEAAPTMVMLAPGEFRMGCLAAAGCRDNEVPVRSVELQTPFALSKFEVTFDQYDRFTDATERTRASAPRGWERGNLPVVNVSWQDATAYAQWLTAETGRTYRLPSEAEWEYAARAGTSTAYSWGDAVGSVLANCNGCGSAWDNVSPAAVGSFNANPWGLHDMHGNVWEWVQDCQWADYGGAPSGAGAREDGDCMRRMLRGGAYSNSVALIRASVREWDAASVRTVDVGFRVAALAD